MTKIILANNKNLCDIFVSNEEYEGVKKIAAVFSKDFYLVTNQKPQILHNIKQSQSTLLMFGTIGTSKWIDEFENSNKLELSKIRGKNEVYQISIVKKPWEGIDNAIVVAGSDKRGTIYGIFKLSEMIGVSPWVYWADAYPEKNTLISFEYSLFPITSKEPSVKYRGFFINDEWPSFGSWTTNKFGGFTSTMYEEVFLLLLRLKGNYLWPAMWTSSFSLDGPGLENSILADTYGIIIGNSHHEPCLRASEEWDIYRGENSVYGNDWNYYTNKDGLLKYWADGLKRNKAFESIITIGMRGERDTSMLGRDATKQENINILKDIILNQRKLIKKYIDPDLKKVPQLLALYKEVEDYYYGDSSSDGLINWQELNDVIIMLCEDNFGNMRTLPTNRNKNHAGGFGMYYHFDYHGGPISYEWVNSSPLTKVWEQMTMAYEYGINKVWIVNVGDLKPQELPLSYFLDLAYDYDKWGINNPNHTQIYTEKWVQQQFGNTLTNSIIENITMIIEEYTRINGMRKPETIYPSTYSAYSYNETNTLIERAQNLINLTKTVELKMPAHLHDTFYQLVYFPAVASMNVLLMNLYASLNQLYSEQGRIDSLTYSKKVEQCIELDRALTNEYNKKCSNGKWDGLMSSMHIGFKNWNDVDWSYPITYKNYPLQIPRMIITTDYSKETYTNGEYQLFSFNQLENQSLTLNICNGGIVPFDFKIVTSPRWLNLSCKKGQITELEKITLAVDWNIVDTMKKGKLIIEGAGTRIIFFIDAKKEILPPLESNTYVELGNYISIEVENYQKNIPYGDSSWKVLKDYGKSLSSMKVFPVNKVFTDMNKSPSLAYSVYVKSTGTYKLKTYIAPTNHLNEEPTLKFAIKVNESSSRVIETIPDGFQSGNCFNTSWCEGVLNNWRIIDVDIELNTGLNTINFYAVDPGIVIQKIVLHKIDIVLPESFLGPPETYHT